MKGGGHGECGGDGSDYEPGATANPEVRDGAPEEVDRLGEDEERYDLGGSADADSLLSEQVGEDAADDAVGEDCIRRYEEAEEPRTFFWGGRVQACGLLQVDFGHAFDVSTGDASSASELNEKTPVVPGSCQLEDLRRATVPF